MINNKKKCLEELNEFKNYLELAKKSFESQLENYFYAIYKNFDLPNEIVKKLDAFFEKTYIIVIKNILEHYKVSAEGKRKGNQFEFSINAPVIVGDELLSFEQLEYLTMKYCMMFQELGLYELGIGSIKILQKYWPSNGIPNEIKFDGDKYSFSYVLNVSCSIKRMAYNKQKECQVPFFLNETLSEIKNMETLIAVFEEKNNMVK